MARWVWMFLLAAVTTVASGEEVDQLIVGGETADIRDFPNQCSFQVTFNGLWYFVCGAVVYNEKTIVTAAHCNVNFPAEIQRVSCGEKNLIAGEETRQRRFIRTSVPHPNFTADFSEGYLYDIAVLEVDEPLELNDYVKPFPFDDGQGNWRRKKCKLSGWGKTAGDGDISYDLQRVNMEKIENEECSKRWAEVDGPPVPDELVCFFEDKKARTACSGDSGGPVRCGNTVVGITSWGDRYCTGNLPIVYTRVSPYYKWLKDNAF